MTETKGKRPADDPTMAWTGPCERRIHTEHQAALDATLFRSAADPFELVLELDAGKLRLRDEADSG